MEKPVTPTATLIAHEIGSEGLEQASEAASAFFAALPHDGDNISVNVALMSIHIIASSMIGAAQEDFGDSEADTTFAAVASMVGEAYISGISSALERLGEHMDNQVRAAKDILGDDSESTGD